MHAALACPRRPRRLASAARGALSAALLAALGLLACAVPAGAEDGSGRDALEARRAALADDLARSPFGRPLLLQSGGGDSSPNGQVFALIDHPIGAVQDALKRPENWCAVMLLQTNIKRCNATPQQLEVGVARKYTDPADQAQAIRFRWRVPAAQPDYLAVDLSADEGPLGTSHYTLRFEAVPAGTDKTFVHMSYAYDTGLAARLATSAYLATAGKDKVGFTPIGRDATGRPQRIGGIQGVAERNTMRYFLAIESFLDSLDAAAPQRLDKRLRGFHASLERYPAQLHETTLDEYLEMKHREIGPG